MYYAAFVAALDLVFAGLVFRQYLKRRGAHQLWWAVGLACGAVGAAAYVLAAALDSVTAFKLYYTGGALATTAYMGLGSLYVAGFRTAASRLQIAVHALVAAGALSIYASGYDPDALQRLQGGSGVGVLNNGPWLVPVILSGLFGMVVVVGVALRTLWRRRTQSLPAAFLWGQVLIAAGVLVISGAGSAARLGVPGAFWLTMALGWAIAFAGFWRTDRAPLAPPRLRLVKK